MSEQNTRWYRQNGREGDVVISTRVRLARNLCGFPFPDGMTAPQRQEICGKVHGALDLDERLWRYYDMAGLSALQAQTLVERHLISPEFAACEEGCGLFLTEEESVSIMVCEEDHLRMQALGAGAVLDELYGQLDCLDDKLDAALHFAFDERLGYLTQCPTNLGTGMRASVMLHLPALQEQGILQPLANTVSKLGLTIRGMYGEGSRSEGALYQLSNQVTLGLSEETALNTLKTVVDQILRRERTAREEMVKNPLVADRIYRSLGLLQNARLLPHEEAMRLLSFLRVGVSAGVLSGISLDTLNGLMYEVQPAAVMQAAGEELEPTDRDAARAKRVRDALKEGR